jgi:ring-1,2-phenylacetyl-CoA epoxidase subunit PaaC
LGGGAGEDRDRTQSALDRLYPHALGLFEPTDGDEPLAQAGICPDEAELQRQWESAVAPVLAESGLTAPETAVPVYGGRVGRHPEVLAKLLEDLQHVHSVDPSANR